MAYLLAECAKLGWPLQLVGINLAAIPARRDSVLVRCLRQLGKSLRSFNERRAKMMDLTWFKAWMAAYAASEAKANPHTFHNDQVSAERSSYT